MLVLITGEVLDQNERYAIIDVHGLGYKVYAPKDTLAALHAGERATLSTHLVVKEDALDLYGFRDEAEKNFFELLISISGIGPKGALGILNLAPMETLEQAIASGDSGYLTKVSGIGKKTANKLVLELKDKLEARSPDERRDTDSGGAYRQESEALDALQSLGYSLREARDALSEIPKETEKSDDKIREALKVLGK